MAPIPIAQPDGPKIRALIIERYPELSHAQAVQQIARRISRHPQSIYVIEGRADKPAASKTFIRQLARELGVRPSDISDMDDDSESDAETSAALDAENGPAAGTAGPWSGKCPAPQSN